MWHSVVEGAFDAIVTMDMAGTIVNLNPAAERMFGYPREQTIGGDLGGLVVPDDCRDQYRLALERARTADAADAGRFEMQALRCGAQRFPIELSVSCARTPSGEVLVAWIRDLSERRVAEEALRLSEMQLRQALKMEAVGRLAGGVAHDFNNVLTAIFGYADLLLDGLDLDDERRADVEEIKRAANRAAALTRQLLAFSRRQVMQPRRMNLNEIITNIETLLAKLVGDDVQLRICADPAAGEVLADPGQIEQVLMNLAANARDAMPEGGVLSIATANIHLPNDETPPLAGITSGRFVTLNVSDTGHGVPEHVRPHVFEPFFTTKEQGKGTGLGLATVYGIVKQSGGWIYLDEAPGRGASFTVYLPRVD